MIFAPGELPRCSACRRRSADPMANLAGFPVVTLGEWATLAVLRTIDRLLPNATDQALDGEPDGRKLGR